MNLTSPHIIIIKHLLPLWRAAAALLALLSAMPATAHDVAADTTEISTTLDEVVVEATQRGNYLSSGAMLKTETIGRAGLAKMACCTVAESFENSAAVTVGYSDAVSGARQIRLLGLAGTYTQLLDESRPMMRALAAPYALDYTPGEWLRSIQVAKGVTSVASGHEAITGQINLEYRRPTDDERLHMNVYLNDMLRAEVNLSTAVPLTRDKRLSTVVMAHGAFDTDWRSMSAMDRNHDGFRDLPASRQVDVANRWLWLAPSGLQLRWGARFTTDVRTGGQLGYHHHRAEREALRQPGATRPALYGSHISNREASAYVKAALPVGDAGTDDDGNARQNNVALIADFAHFVSTAYYGLNDYYGRDNTATLTLRYDHHFSGSATLAVGVQGRTTSIGERLAQQRLVADGSGHLAPLDDYDLGRHEREAGAFAEWTQQVGNSLTVVAGMREDYNSLCRRWSFTPRAHVKWSITARTTLRASAGTGFRTPSPISDNIAIMATGREVRLALNDWRLERAVNFGGSLTQTFALGRDQNASVSIDYFRTHFSTMAYADQESSAALISVAYNDAQNYTDTWQIDANWSPLLRLDVLATFRYTNSRLTLLPGHRRVERPLVHRYKGVLNVAYATKFSLWAFSATAQLNGPARIPVVDGKTDDSRHSPTYVTLYAQVTRKIPRGEVYVGCENIADYRQHHVIDAPDAPFTTEFNASRIWGPVMGRRIYVGVRWNIY